jgi:Sulfotransferase family
MILSHTKRFIVLAPWKNATSTMFARLGVYSESPYCHFYHFNRTLNKVMNQHITYADFAALPESRLGYLTAAFVRNPYDRVYSGFRQLQKDLQEQPTVEFPDPVVQKLLRTQLSDNFANLCQAGLSFEPWLALVDDYMFLHVGRNSSFPLHPSHYWTHYNGTQAVDFVGRVENFEQDFERLCDRIGIDVSDHVTANVAASESELAGDERGYRYVDRMSPDARRKINHLFRDDFDIFGYERVE